MTTPAPKLTGLTDAEIEKLRLPFVRLALVIEFKDPEPSPETPVVLRASTLPKKAEEAFAVQDTEHRWSHLYHR